MGDILEVIGASPLFTSLPEAYLREIEGIAQRKLFPRGKLIFTQGDSGDGFFIVMSGTVKVFKLSPDGKEKILHILGSGEPFGEVAVFSGETFPANAEALARSELLYFSKASFIELISSNPSVLLSMLAILSKRLKQFATQIEDLSLKDVPGRLAGYLIYLTQEQQNRRSVSLTITKGQLASLLGTIPETLSRILSKMNSARIIEVRGGEIAILDFSGLTHLAELGRFPAQ